MKIKFSYTHLSAGLRTAGALMLGNVAVAHFVFEKALEQLAVLFLIGITAILLTSFEENKK